MLTRRSDDSYNPVYYRRNTDRARWEYWSPSNECWKLSFIYNVKENDGPKTDYVITVVDYKDTWCEPINEEEEE